MGRYILKRLGISVAVIFLVSVISFTLVHMLPGDPAVLALGSEASEQDIATFREKYYSGTVFHLDYRYTPRRFRRFYYLQPSGINLSG